MLPSWTTLLIKNIYVSTVLISNLWDWDLTRYTQQPHLETTNPILPKNVFVEVQGHILAALFCIFFCLFVCSEFWLHRNPSQRAKFNLNGSLQRVSAGFMFQEKVTKLLKKSNIHNWLNLIWAIPHGNQLKLIEDARPCQQWRRIARSRARMLTHNTQASVNRGEWERTVETVTKIDSCYL